MEKTPNFTVAQENLIRKAAVDNGGVLNLAIAKELAAMPAMNDANGDERSYRSVVAKINRMLAEGDFTYERKGNVTKTGEPVTKKTDLVARIAAAANVTVAKLDGLDKATKGALQILVDFAEAA